MAKTPMPPGPPPLHYRPPGSPRPPEPLPEPRRLRQPAPTPPPPRRSWWAPAAALVVLILGSAVAFAAWQSAEDSPDEDATTGSTSSTLATGGTIPPNAPTSSGPPSTDLDPNVIGTVEDPIPLGEPYILGVFEVTVNSADLDASDTLAGHDRTNPEPREGQRRILVNVTIRFVESQGFTDTAYLPFEVRSGGETWTDLDASCGNVPDSILRGVLLGPGDSATGNLCFTVPEDHAASVLLTTEGFDGPVYFELR